MANLKARSCRPARRCRTLLGRLRSDARGNVLALTAAAMVPLIGLVGSGVDIARSRLANTRLQQACDAGVLAGRKMLTDTVTPAVTAETTKFVRYNYPNGTLGAAAFAVAPTLGANQRLNLTLNTTIPTAVMQFFGIQTMAVSATCTARQDFVNTDVMLILDTTLSMNCLPTESATTLCQTEKKGSKIQALRAGVTALYDALSDPQKELEKAGLRLRYGIVPYSLTVNTGRLIRAVNSSYMQENSPYQSCTSYTNNGTVCSAAKVVNSSGRTNATFWDNKSKWAGCIEERATVNTINASSGYTPPAGATDLNVDLVPNSEATKWRAYDPDSVTADSTVYSNLYATCPKEARRLAAFDTVDDINDWMSTLTAGGYTYLDTGLIWGARLLSRNGLWKDDNPLLYKTFKVNRHVIFMTDGAMDPDPSAYSAYGVEKFDKRVSNGTDAAQLASHVQRVRMMCNAIKNLNGDNVTLWVIAFGSSTGTGLSTELQNCGSSGKSYKANDQDQLEKYFRQIGESIGALRVAQ